MVQTIAQMSPKGSVAVATDLFEADSGTGQSYYVTGAQIAQGASRVVTASIYEKMRRFYRESRKNNPHYNAVMATPPTIAVTSTVPSGLTKSYVPQSGGAGAFYQTGGTPLNYVTGTRYPLVTLTNGGSNGNCSNGQNANGWRVKVKVDSIAPCFQVLNNTGNGYRFVVDGQYVSLTGTSAPNGGYSNYIQLIFAARGQHEIWLEGDSASAFYGLYVLPTECACPPQAGLTWLILGDSLTSGTSTPAIAENDGFAQVLGDCFGAGNLYESGSGGEGILNPANTGAGYTLRQRLPWDFLPCDICVIAMGTNDSTYSAPALEGEIQLLLAAIRTTYTFTGPIFFLGVPANASGPSAAVLATEAAYLMGVQQFNDPNVFFIPTANAAPESMLFGTGHVGATNNSGNSDWAVCSDITHPTLEGHYYDGCWFADRIFNVVQNLP